MSVARIGLSIGRKSATLVVIDARGRKPSILEKFSMSRHPGDSLRDICRELLGRVSANFRKSQITVALSPSELSCADLLDVPFTHESQLESAKGSLAESCCAGEVMEDLAIDAALRPGRDGKSQAEVVAIDLKTLGVIRAAIKEALPQSALAGVTSIPSTLIATVNNGLHAFWFKSSGEAVVVNGGRETVRSWRTIPLDSQATDGQARIQLAAESIAPGAGSVPVFEDGMDVTLNAGRASLRVSTEFVAAAAAALASLETTTNVLRGAPDAPKRLAARVRMPLLIAGSAAAVLLLSCGLYFRKQAARIDASLKECSTIERKLWTVYLPSKPYYPTRLLDEMKAMAEEHKKAVHANRAPSALAFWGELGSVMPNPDGIGMTLETVTLNPQEGRIEGRVTSDPSNPLANASQLEKALNSSENLTAHGEFETKGTEVAVRIRLDYMPDTSRAGIKSP